MCTECVKIKGSFWIFYIQIHVRKSPQWTTRWYTTRWYTQSQYINGTIDINVKMHIYLMHPESKMQKACKFPQMRIKSNSFGTQKTDFVFLWCLGWMKSKFSKVGLIWVWLNLGLAVLPGKRDKWKENLNFYLALWLYWKRSLSSFTKI